MIIWLLIGLAAGAIAKHLTPQNEKGGWVSSAIIGIAGSIAGGFVAGVLGMNGKIWDTLAGDFFIATAGSVLVLFIYHKFFADKWNLPI